MAGESGFTIWSSQGGDGIATQAVTTPFYPIFSFNEAGDLSVQFSQGYIFDYSNSKALLDPVPVKSGVFQIEGEGAESKFYVRIAFQKSNGQVIKTDGECKIVAESELPANVKQRNAYERLPITSDFHFGVQNDAGIAVAIDPEDQAGNFYWYMKLIEFEKAQIKTLYLRDNLHLNLLKIRQMGNLGSNEQVPVICKNESYHNPKSPTQHWQGNGVLSFISIGKITNGKFEQDQGENLIEFQYDDGKGVLKIGISDQLIETKLQGAMGEIARATVNEMVKSDSLK